MKDILFNVFECGFCPKTLSRLESSQKEWLLLSFPLTASFTRHHLNAPKNQSYAKYTNAHSEWQEQILEEVARKTDADDIFAQIVDSFYSKFPRFFIKQMAHSKTPFC